MFALPLNPNRGTEVLSSQNPHFTCHVLLRPNYGCKRHEQPSQLLLGSREHAQGALAARSPLGSLCIWLGDRIADVFPCLPLAFLRHTFSNCTPLTANQAARWVQSRVLLPRKKLRHSLRATPAANSAFYREGWFCPQKLT